MALALQRFDTPDANYIAKHNNNSAAIETAVNNLETSKQSVSQKSQPGGYPALDGNGRIPVGQIPVTVQTKDEKGALNGYASLDASGHVPMSQLPASIQTLAGGQQLDLSLYQLKSEKGIANGYAGLDANGKVPAAQLPEIASLENYQTRAEKGAANGYAALGADGKVPSAQLPAANAQLYITGGFKSGVLANAELIYALLPTVDCHFAAGFASSRAKAQVAATAQTVFSIKKNGVQVGTITFEAAGIVGTFAAASPVDLATTDELTIESPAQADATLAGVRFTLHGTR